MNIMNKAAVLGGIIVATTVTALAADPVDYSTQLNTNLTTINSIWGSVATIMIGVALVTVGVRFFRKAK